MRNRNVVKGDVVTLRRGLDLRRWDLVLRLSIGAKIDDRLDAGILRKRVLSGLSCEVTNKPLAMSTSLGRVALGSVRFKYNSESTTPPVTSIEIAKSFSLDIRSVDDPYHEMAVLSKPSRRRQRRRQ